MSDSSTVIELVARAKGSDKDAWNEIVGRFAPLVWSICRKYRLSPADVEDVGQNVWLRLVEHLPAVREPIALPGWLATTTHRECLRVVKVSRLRAERDHRTGTSMLVTAAEPPPPDGGVLAAERDAALRAAFGQLPAHCQELLGLLTHDPPLSYAEISNRLNMRIGGIGPNRARCLDRLRRCPPLAAWIRADADSGRKDVPNV
jgi:RNA polymerase sigma factor (sigma-70 family)